MENRTNRLARERSLYLRQHAHNPVDWYPYGAEALGRARREDRPIFLSVGYSSCHWCHVMEREVFEKEDVAELLNASFVCIKVDREERPDLDAAYMEALQAMTGSGGWPMSLFLTPDGKPFFGATYIPHTPFLEVGRQILRAYHEQRDLIAQQAALLARSLTAGLRLHPEEVATEPGVAHAAERALELVDERWGGLGGPPKFPTPPRWSFLLHRLRKTGDERLGSALRVTLDAMASGGIRDQLGGGFHRYSVDQTWLVPHFEKMLYDNAQLASLYLEAAVALDAPHYAQVARDTLDFLLREMRDPEGGFYASFDADSDGGEVRGGEARSAEGSYYLWTLDELREVCGGDADALAATLGVTAEGNFEGKSILTRRQAATAEAVALLERWRPALLERRSRRPAPALDRKIVTSWNGLAIAALAQTASLLDDPHYEDAARAAAERLWRLHRRADGGLFRASSEGEPAGAGVLTDYTNLAGGLLDLFQLTQDPTPLRRGLELIRYVLKHFAAPEGGFYLTADDQPAPLGRLFDFSDSVRPSGGAHMLRLLVRAAALTGDESLLEPVERSLTGFGSLLRRAPTETLGWFDAAQMQLGPYAEVVIAGAPGDAATEELVAAFRHLSPSHAVLIRVPALGPPPELQELLPSTAHKTALAGFPTAYVCRFGSCQTPTTDPGVLRQQILEGWSQ
jgi:uncharacterized protein